MKKRPFSTSPSDPLANPPSPAGRVTALYAHIPFCRSRCAYCGFVTTNRHTEADRDRYLDLLCREANHLENCGLFAGRKASLLYIGGGTPTVLSPVQIRRLTKWLADLLPLAKGFEFTCEGHPGSLLGDMGRERLAALAEGRVNRLSLGVQDFLPAVLEVCNRHHTYDQIREALQAARSVGIQNVNLDFIYGLPGQTPGTWRKTLSQAIELNPQSITVYRIRLKEGTGMALRGECEFPDDAPCAEMRAANLEVLTRAGYVHLLANQFALPGYMFYDQFALPGCTYRYEVENWLPYRDTIGLGVASYSLLGDRTCRNFSSREFYDNAVARKASAVAGGSHVSKEQHQLRTLILGLRRPALGVDKDLFRAYFGCNLDQRYPAIAGELVNPGLLASTHRTLRLTEMGLNNPDELDKILMPLYWKLAGGKPLRSGRSRTMNAS